MGSYLQWSQRQSQKHMEGSYWCLDVFFWMGIYYRAITQLGASKPITDKG